MFWLTSAYTRAMVAISRVDCAGGKVRCGDDDCQLDLQMKAARYTEAGLQNDGLKFWREGTCFWVEGKVDGRQAQTPKLLVVGLQWG
jgi:hypothetical protein